MKKTKDSFLNNNWKIVLEKKLPKKPIIVSGMPGMGNVAKIAVDYIIEKLKLEPIGYIYGKFMPYSVIVNEDNTVEVPKFYIYSFKNKKMKILFYLQEIANQ